MSDLERNRKFGALLKKSICDAGYTQAEFSRLMGITPSRLSNYITGNRLPDFFTICEICRRLGVSTDLFDPDITYVCGAKSVQYLLTVGVGGSVSLDKVK